jgi:hypothetical protein
LQARGTLTQEACLIIGLSAARSKQYDGDNRP